MILALLGIAATIYLIVHNPATAQRWQGALSEAKFSGREKIFPTAIEMISEYPFLGWQPGRFQYALARRLYNSEYFGSKDAHNVFLHLFLEVGMVGAVPFLVGFWLCGQAAWKGRTRFFGLLPLALFCTILAGSMSGTTLLRKPMWLVLALASASASITTAGQTNTPRRWLILRSSGGH
jgi:O-antigen ligase